MGAAKSSFAIGSLEAGKIISIKARIPSDANRFSVDLACRDGSIAFHFNPRFDERKPVVVCNTWTKTWLWWREERPSKMPFSKGNPFEMVINIKSQSYEVFVNGEFFLTFDHRLPYHTVEKVEFRGDIADENVSWSSLQGPPPYAPPVQGDVTGYKA